MQKTLTAKSMGSRSARILSTTPREYSIRGVTSRGIYLAAGEKSIIFLTRDPTRGPFTINIPGLDSDLAGINPGDCVLFEKQSFNLRSGLLSISTGQAEIWEPLPPEGLPLGIIEQITLAREIARRAIDRKGWVGLAGLLPGLLDLGDLTPPDTDPLGMDHIIREILTALRASDAERLGEALRKSLGRGPGLTPSGDDLCAGILLKLKRGMVDRTLEAVRDQVAGALIEKAYGSTTTYSANLIEAAAAGEADERMIAACDCITCGIPDPKTAAEGVIRWGSSSGIDTLTGICLACLAGV